MLLPRVQAGDSPEGDKGVDDGVAREFSARLVVVERPAGHPVVDAAANGTADAQAEENQEIDDDVEVGLLLDLGPLGRSLAWFRRESSSAPCSG